MADSFSVSYDEKLYTAGENDYDNIKSSLSTVMDDVKNYTDKLKEIEGFTPSIVYGGVLQDMVEGMSTALSNLSEKLEVSSTIVSRAKHIVELYNKSDSDMSADVCKFLLDNLKMTYKNSFDSNFKNGTALKTDLYYQAIFDNDFTPQGITIVGNKVIISAYKKDEYSRLYIFNPDNNSYYIVGLDNKSHVGGVSYDEVNHVLLVTGSNGAVNAYNYDAMESIASKSTSESYNGKTVILNLANNAGTKQKIKLDSNINMNYEKMANGNKLTGYNAGSVYVDTKSNQIFINRFAKDGKLVYGDLVYDKDKGTYTMKNPKSMDIDNGVQGVATYHKGGNTYLVESRSYAGTSSQITVRNITNGKNILVGTKKFDNKYMESIHVDENGIGTAVYENGTFNPFNKNDSTRSFDVNEIIKENNKESGNVIIITNKFEKGEPNKDGY